MWIIELKTTMLVTLLLAIMSLNYSQGYVLICEFGNEEWINLGIVFQCKVQGMDITSRNSITEVVGEPFRPIRDVKALDVQDQRCQFVPSDVQTFFPNIEGLQVANSELKELQSDDMQQFPNLKQLFMSENELQSLENDVFEHCPNIEYVNLGHNNIMHMGTDIFAPLKNLQYCNIAGNSCIDTKMESPNAIEQFSKAVEMQCPPTPEMLKREKERKIPESLRTMAPPTTTTVAPEINDIKEELKKLKNKIAEHDQKIDEIKSKEENSTSPSMSSPPPTNQDQNTPEQNIQPPYTSPTNNLPDLNRPKHSSPNSSPMGYNLVDLVNLPVPNYQPYQSNPNPPQSPNMPNSPPQDNPQYFQNTPPQSNTPVQCGPYGCVPPNTQPFPPNLPAPSQEPNLPEVSNPRNPSAHGENPSLPYPYPYRPIPVVNKPPFPVYPSPTNTNESEGTKPNSDNVAPKNYDPQNPQLPRPDNPNSPQNVQPQIPEEKQTPPNPKNGPPQYPAPRTPPASTNQPPTNDEALPTQQHQPDDNNPATNPKPSECSSYSCPSSEKQPDTLSLRNSASSDEPSIADDEKQQNIPELPPMPYRNLDVESSFNDPQYPPQMNNMQNPEPQASYPLMDQTSSPNVEELPIENVPQNQQNPDPGSSPQVNDKRKSTPPTSPTPSSTSSPPASSTPTPFQPTDQTPLPKDDELSEDPNNKNPKHPEESPQNMDKPKECDTYGCSLSVPTPKPSDPTKSPQTNDNQNTEAPVSPPSTNEDPPSTENELLIPKTSNTENPQNSHSMDTPSECDSPGCPATTDKQSTDDNSQKYPPTRKPSLISPKKSQESQKPNPGMKKRTPPPTDVEDFGEDTQSPVTEGKELEDDTTINPDLEEKIEELVIENEKKDNEIIKLLKKIQELEEKSKKQEKEIKALKL